ncbi:monocarboxylate transporter 3 isoform X1 [Macaca fascicularis]|uniref:monocarboxylate transporter 3 isoform X1 n=1 Tax=Macaca fascicularis TaxID=9541 RepID=UPI003D15B558
MGAGGPRRGEGPPDGGWGWVVLGACFVVTGFAYGFPKAVSVFFRALMRDFGAGYSDTAWVSSIMLAMLYGTGPVSSILVTRFGCRPVMLAGGLLASAGMILASFATRLLELYLTAGVLTGEGPLVSSPLVWGSGVLAARSALGFPMWDSLRSPSAGFLDLLGSRAWPLPPAGAREGLPGDPGTAPPRPQAWAWPSTSSRRSSCWGCTSSGGGLWPTGWRRRAAPCSCPRCRRSASSCWSASAGAAASCCSAGSCCTAAPAGLS